MLWWRKAVLQLVRLLQCYITWIFSSLSIWGAYLEWMELFQMQFIAYSVSCTEWQSKTLKFSSTFRFLTTRLYTQQIFSSVVEFYQYGQCSFLCSFLLWIHVHPFRLIRKRTWIPIHSLNLSGCLLFCFPHAERNFMTACCSIEKKNFLIRVKKNVAGFM